jgi:outer membrane protein W
MSTHILRRPLNILIIILLSAAGAAAEDPAGTAESAQAEAPPVRKWEFRFGAVLTDTNGGSTVNVEPGLVTSSIDWGGGAGISFERRISPLVGIEFGIAATGSNFNVSSGIGAKDAFVSTDTLFMTPLTLGANFHLVNEGPIDVYAGPLLAYNLYSELTTRTGAGWPGSWPWDGDEWTSVTVRWEANSELSWGARAGLGVFFGKKKKWSGQVALTYLDATYEVDRGTEAGSESISLDPLMLGFGFGLRF